MEKLHLSGGFFLIINLLQAVSCVLHQILLYLTCQPSQPFFLISKISTHLIVELKKPLFFF